MGIAPINGLSYRGYSYSPIYDWFFGPTLLLVVMGQPVSKKAPLEKVWGFLNSQLPPGLQ